MNLLDAWVTQIVGTPFKNYGKWWVAVVAVCEGVSLDTAIMCHTKEEAEKVVVGYKFLT